MPVIMTIMVVIIASIVVPGVAAAIPTGVIGISVPTPITPAAQPPTQSYPEIPIVTNGVIIVRIVDVTKASVGRAHDRYGRNARTFGHDRFRCWWGCRFLAWLRYRRGGRSRLRSHRCAGCWFAVRTRAQQGHQDFRGNPLFAQLNQIRGANLGFRRILDESNDHLLVHFGAVQLQNIRDNRRYGGGFLSDQNCVGKHEADQTKKEDRSHKAKSTQQAP